MKNIFSGIIFSIVCMVSASAAEITMFVGSKPGGSMLDMSQILADHLTSKGHTVDFQVMGNCSKAQTAMSNSNGKSVMIVYNAFVNLPGCEDTMPQKNTFVSNLLSFPMMVCGKTDLPLKENILNKQKGSVAIIKSHPKEMVTTLNPNFTAVPYANSGAAMKGFLAGDTEYIMTTVPKASKIVKSGEAKCVLTTASESTLGAEPAEKTIPEWSYRNLTAALGLVQRGFNDNEMADLRAEIDAFSKSQSWVDYAKKSTATIDTGFSLDRFQETANQWIPRK